MLEMRKQAVEDINKILHKACHWNHPPDMKLMRGLLCQLFELCQ